jgi:hypothetical protein
MKKASPSVIKSYSHNIHAPSDFFPRYGRFCRT